MNVDRTLVKISIQDLFKLNEAIDIISKDINRYNDDNGNLTEIYVIYICLDNKNLRNLEVIAEINKDLEFERRTFIERNEESQLGSVEEGEDSKYTFKEATTRRKVSEVAHGVENTLMHQNFTIKQKQTRDSGFIKRTGSMANPDDDSYQTKLEKVQSKLETEQRQEE